MCKRVDIDYKCIGLFLVVPKMTTLRSCGWLSAFLFYHKIDQCTDIEAPSIEIPVEKITLFVFLMPSSCC